jgi:L-alanine-DL-glutamate epimerase-like enolase superfamily enzyme
VKLKVGARSVEDDVELVRAVRGALGDAARS